MKLIIAEKPSVGIEIAKIVNATEKLNGFYKGNNYCVSWCIGHLIQLAEPQIYDEKYNKWILEDLPILPTQFEYKTNPKTYSQFKVLKTLFENNEITDIICATDAGREGELIFRLVYNFLNCKKPVYRLWTNSLEEKSIIDGLNNLKPKNQYDNLYYAAIARQQADWLIGMNFTRFYTTLYGQLLTIGRVQTPTINLIVERQKEIDNFISKPYYKVNADLGFNAFYKTESLEKAQEVANKCGGCEAYVSKVEKKDKCTNAPPLYDLTTLQRQANKLLGYSAIKTLEHLQQLYEKKLTTYPRTDSQYITEDMMQSTNDILDLLFTNKLLSNNIINSCDKKNINLKKVVNNAKVTDHHAILPTLNVSKQVIDTLNEEERNILTLILYRTISAVYAPYKAIQTKAIFDIEGEPFVSDGVEIIDIGFKFIDNELQSLFSQKSNTEKNNTLPPIGEGNTFAVKDISIDENFTQPPKYYTEDTLLSAMETCGKKISEDALREVMKDRGLGTPATRANIIENIIKTGYIDRDKKNLIPTAKAKKFISIALSELKDCELTAQWEFKLSLIEKGELSFSCFINDIQDFIKKIISTTQSFDTDNYKNTFNGIGTKEIIGYCPKCGAEVFENKNAFSCSAGKDKCNFYIWKTIATKTLTKAQVKLLLENRKTGIIKGFKSKSGKTFDTCLILNDNGEIAFNFV